MRVSVMAKQAPRGHTVGELSVEERKWSRRSTLMNTVSPGFEGRLKHLRDDAALLKNEGIEKFKWERGKYYFSLPTNGPSSGFQARFDSLNERVDGIYRRLDHATTLAEEVAEAPFSRLDQVEEKTGKLIRSLELVLSRAEVRITAEDAKAMGRVEKLEKNVEMLTHKVDALCKHLGIVPNQRDEIRRRPRSSDEDMGELESLISKTASETAGAQTPALAPALLDHPVGDLVPHDLAPDAAAPTSRVADGPADHAAAPMEHHGCTDTAPAVAPANPSAPTDSPAPPEAGETPANAAAPPANAATALTNAAATIVPAAHPGVTVIHATPDNSQDRAATHSTLILPGAFNAAGMRTRSRSRSQMPAPMPPPVPPPVPGTADIAAAQSATSSRGSSKSPRPPKRTLDAEGSGSKRQRQC